MDLPEALDVDLVQIEAKLEGILEKSNGKMQLERGEVLCDYYLSSLVKDIIDHLSSSESGVDNVGEIASRFNLPAKVISNALSKQQGEGFTASFEPSTGILRSDTFVQKVRAMAREALLGVTDPSPLADIADPLQIPMNILLETLDEMRKGGEIEGEVEGRGARALFVPSRFSLEAFKLASADLFKNEFISFVQLDNMAINDPHLFLEKTDSSAVTLDTCIVCSSLFSSLEAAISECKLNKSWIDGRALLPPDFPDDDVSSLITKATEASLGGKSSESDSPEKKNKKVKKRKQLNPAESLASAKSIFSGRFVLSSPVLLSIQDAVISLAQGSSRELVQPYKVMVESGSSLPWTKQTSDKAGHAAEESTGKKGKGKNRKRSNTKDGRAVAAGNPEPGNTSPNQSVPSVNVPSASDVVQLVAKNVEIRNILNSDDMGNTGLLEDVLAAVVDGIYGENGLGNLYHEHAQSAVMSLEKRRAEIEQAFEQELLNSLDKIGVYDRTADTLQDKKFIDASRNCLFQTIVIPTVVSILRRMALVESIPWSEEAFVSEVSQSDKLKRLREVQRKFPPDIASRLKPFVSSLAVKPSKGFANFLAAYDKLPGHVNVPRRRPVDKKKERSLSMAIRAELLDVLQKETLDSRIAFDCAVSLLHSKNSHGAVVLLPPKMVAEYSVLVEKAVMSPEAQAALQGLRSCAEARDKGESPHAAGVTSDEMQCRRAISEFVR